MEVTEHIEILRTQGMLLADSAEITGLEAAVPTCPEWTVRDLLLHLGEVYRWAHLHISQELQEPAKVAFTPDSEDLLMWYREGHALVLQALEAADPEADYWGFLPGPRGTRFWARRQAHETTIHRVDAQCATGEASHVDPAHAADGIDEVLHGFYARRPSRLTSPSPVSFTLVSTDGPHAWQVTIDADGPSTVDGDGETAGRVQGSTCELYLLLWNRIGLDGLTVAGSTAGLDLWRDKARIRWS